MIAVGQITFEEDAVKTPNAQQKLILRIAAVAIGALFIYPPVGKFGLVEQQFLIPAGYNWFWMDDNGDNLVGIESLCRTQPWLGASLSCR